MKKETQIIENDRGGGKLKYREKKVRACSLSLPLKTEGERGRVKDISKWSLWKKKKQSIDNRPQDCLYIAL